jgi:dihydrofolate reductase
MLSIFSRVARRWKTTNPEPLMSKVKVLAFSISLDGYGAGPDQSIDNPLGIGGERLHEWFLPTRAFQRMHGGGGGSTDVDNAFAEKSFANIGAWILGRNMFGPVRGPWPDDTWKGWWGDTPPYRVPVFVLTHHARAPIDMDGGTTFHFVTGGIDEALARARAAAAGKDIRIGGGAATIRQYLEAGAIDEMHLAMSPVLLGRGEPLLQGIDLRAAGFACTEHVGTAKATHVVLTR